ncbi:hypothetical protein SAMN05216311_12062 [Chitinophaga sp. CF418]|nr:hypothetical protein SAMN05216311_12062 [Chitinophaga sp. CF418]
MKRMLLGLMGYTLSCSLFCCGKPKDGPIHVRSDGYYYVMWHMPQGLRVVLDHYTTFDFDYNRFAISLAGGLYLKADSIESAGRLVKIALPGMELSTRNAAMAIEYYAWDIPAQAGKPNYAVLDLEDGFVKIKGKNTDTVVSKGVCYITKAGKVMPGRRPFFMISADRLLYYDEITLGKLRESIEGLYGVRVAFDEQFTNSVLYNVDIDIRKNLAAQLPALTASGSFDFTLDTYNKVLNIRPR